MRYIDKPQASPARQLLNDQRAWMRSEELDEKYDNLGSIVNAEGQSESVKKILNDQLRQEQGHVCCYCQQRILQHNGDNATGSHNEHFYPEDTNIPLQLDYENLYACCNRSKGLENRLQHCGEHKHNMQININLLHQHNCSDYFKYNVNGEILPVGPWASTREIPTTDQLSPDQQLAMQYISILNLNVDTLVQMRKNVIDDIMPMVLNMNKHKINTMVQTINSNKADYPEFVDMIIYFCKRWAI